VAIDLGIMIFESVSGSVSLEPYFLNALLAVPNLFLRARVSAQDRRKYQIIVARLL